MSTIRTDLLQNRLGTSHPAVTKADFVKAWGFVDQRNTQTLGQTFNVSSTLDAGVGWTTFTWTASFTTQFYTATSGIMNTVGDYDRALVNAFSASQLQLAGIRAAITTFDSMGIHCMAVGVLA